MQELHLPSGAVSSVLSFRLPRFLVRSKSQKRILRISPKIACVVLEVCMELRHAGAARERPPKMSRSQNFGYRFVRIVTEEDSAGKVGSKRLVLA